MIKRMSVLIEEPLTLTLSPQSWGKGTGGVHRASDTAICNPLCDANKEPLTLALSPQSRGEGIEGAHRASDTVICNPSCDANEETLPSVGEGSGRLSRATFLAVLFAAILPGCATARNMIAFRPRDPLAGAPRFTCVSSPRLEQVVAHLNQNTDRINGWRANRVRIHAKGLALPMQGRLAVEKGRHVRLEVTSPMGVEVDIGSNDQRFWVWSRHMDPAFVTCKHENTEAVRQTLGIPFEPDWMMEALGVAPIPTEDVTFQAAPTNDQARLVQQVVSAHGRPLRRVLLVDLKRGGFVTEHALYDYGAHPIAVAKLSDHRYDRQTGAVLPHHVVLDWPQNQMSVTMELGSIDVNPKSIPSQIWAMPERPGHKIVNLDADIDSTRIATRSSSAVQLGTIEEAETSEDEFAADNDTPGASTHDLIGHSRITNPAVESDDSEKEDDWSN